MQFQADKKRIGQGLKSGIIPSLLSFRRNDNMTKSAFLEQPHRQQKHRNARHFVITKPPPPRSDYDCRHFSLKPIVSSNFELILSVATNDWGILIRV